MNRGLQGEAVFKTPVLKTVCIIDENFLPVNENIAKANGGEL
jgi:hypothetical protein